MDAVLHSSADMDWRTPPAFTALLRMLSADGQVHLDAFTKVWNPIGALRWCAPDHPDIALRDGLSVGWSGPGLHFANPPYGRFLGLVAEKANQERALAEFVFLVPARTDTQWWLGLASACDAVLFWEGRMSFLDGSGAVLDPAPFPCSVFYAGHRLEAFRSVFGPFGKMFLTGG